MTGTSFCLLGTQSSCELEDRLVGLHAICPGFSETFQRAPCGDTVRAPSGETEVSITRHLAQSGLWLLRILPTALKWLWPPHATQRGAETRQDLVTRPRSCKKKVAEPGLQQA